MKNNTLLISILFAFTFITSCSVAKENPRLSTIEMDTVLQEFTEARINQYLYWDENPKDNLSILMLVLNKHNFNFNEFSENLKKENPRLYEKLVKK